jgi:L-lactate dehydrogenase (cytochrome)
MNDQEKSQRLFMKYPAISDLAIRARQRIPAVAWAYLETGTGEEDLLELNRQAFTDLRLSPQFCQGPLKPEIATRILGQDFQAPFGIAPVGLSGLMWPRAELMLAQTAVRYQIPYTLSTVATETPEAVGPKVGERGWFQLYPPREKDLRRILLDRARNAGFHTLVVTADVPTPSRRERTKRAGLQSPPKLTPGFLWQGMTHPVWSYHTLRRGLPRLRTIDQYVEFDSMMSVGAFVQDQLRGNLSWEYCKELRDIWDGPIILKGVLHPEDAKKAVAIGLDGIVVSNHGGRQFDGAPAALHALPEIVAAVKGKTAILFDSGIRSGLDILRAMQLGAEFVLLGRSFMYGVAALGAYGGDHVAEILIDQLKNNMIQLGIEKLP